MIPLRSGVVQGVTLSSTFDKFFCTSSNPGCFYTFGVDSALLPPAAFPLGLCPVRNLPDYLQTCESLHAFLIIIFNSSYYIEITVLCMFACI